MRDIFISHVEEDFPVVQELAQGLEAAGYSTWYYERDSGAGPSCLLQTRDAIMSAQAVLLLVAFSEDSAVWV
ncbi:MAG: toll/interleukin-1 receptor domain-containing protein [Gemmatimonadota bacterium]